jgi:dephospho-CoA kinase
MVDGQTTIGLTGSIGMGKSTVAGFFADFGCAVWDADAAVHALYQKGNAGFDAIRELLPEACTGDQVDRAVLSDHISKKPEFIQSLNTTIHPLVAQSRIAFQANRADILVFDIPLIFENDNQGQFDLIVVVRANPETQKQRVLARDGMTEEKFQTILANQMPSAEKERLADFVIDTEGTLAETKEQVAKIIEQVRRGAA